MPPAPGFVGRKGVATLEKARNPISLKEESVWFSSERPEDLFAKVSVVESKGFHVVFL